MANLRRTRSLEDITNSPDHERDLDFDDDDDDDDDDAYDTFKLADGNANQDNELEATRRRPRARRPRGLSVSTPPSGAISCSPREPSAIVNNNNNNHSGGGGGSASSCSSGGGGSTSSSGSGSDMRTAASPFIPPLVSSCISILEQRGLDVEGILRVSGSQLLIKELTISFEKGKVTDLSKCEIHTVAGLLKNYFRSAPQPLLTFERYEDFMAITRLPKPERIEPLRQLLDQLPLANQEILHRLVVFINRVAQHSENNKMDTPNLATMFGPNILRQHNQDPTDMLRDMQAIRLVMLTIVQCYRDLYQQWPDDQDRKYPNNPLLYVLEEDPSTKRSSRNDRFLRSPLRLRRAKQRSQSERVPDASDEASPANNNGSYSPKLSSFRSTIDQLKKKASFRKVPSDPVVIERVYRPEERARMASGESITAMTLHASSSLPSVLSPEVIDSMTCSSASTTTTTTTTTSRTTMATSPRVRALATSSSPAIERSGSLSGSSLTSDDQRGSDSDSDVDDGDDEADLASMVRVRAGRSPTIASTPTAPASDLEESFLAALPPALAAMYTTRPSSPLAAMGSPSNARQRAATVAGGATPTATASSPVPGTTTDRAYAEGHMKRLKRRKVQIAL